MIRPTAAHLWFSSKWLRYSFITTNTIGLIECATPLIGFIGHSVNHLNINQRASILRGHVCWLQTFTALHEWRCRFTRAGALLFQEFTPRMISFGSKNEPTGNDTAKKFRAKINKIYPYTWRSKIQLFCLLHNRLNWRSVCCDFHIGNNVFPCV